MSGDWKCVDCQLYSRDGPHCPQCGVFMFRQASPDRGRAASLVSPNCATLSQRRVPPDWMREEPPDARAYYLASPARRLAVREQYLNRRLQEFRS